MASLIEMLNNEKIRTAHTERLYFRRYAYRIGIDLMRLNVKSSRKKFNIPDDFPIQFQNFSQVICDVSELERSIIKRDFSTRQQYNHIRRYYLTDEEDAKAVFEAFKPLIVEANCPLDDEQKSLLLSDEKTIIRRYNFWGRYPWRITFNWMDMSARQQIAEWFSKTFSAQPDIMSERALLSFYPVRLHFSDERDVFLAKCKYGSTINKIEKVVITGGRNDE